MMKITEEDIDRLENFQLRWRWMDPKYALLSGEELKSIKPLHRKKARRAWEIASSFVDYDGRFMFKPSSVSFEGIESIDALNLADEAVRVWLQARLPRTEIVVSWQPELAVVTTSELFSKRFRDFCYPGSDDVSIWPLDGLWIVHFWHEGIIYFGKRRFPASQRIVFFPIARAR